MIHQRHRDMLDLACALSWELDKLLPRMADDADSWDSIAIALVRRMIRDDQATAASLGRQEIDNDRIVIVMMNPGGDA